MADFYTAASDPAANSDLDSSIIRAEWTAIAAGFAKVAGYTGAGSRVVFINSGATAQTTDAELTYNATTNVLTVNGSTFGTNTSVGGTLGVTGAATLSSTLTYGGVTLTAAVTGTGKMVLDTSPAITTSLTTPSTTFAMINTTATTVNAFGGASVALNIGHASGTNTVLGATTFSQKVTATAAGIDVATSALGNCYSDTYTPTVSNTSNVSSSTPKTTSFSRIGNRFSASGFLLINPTGAGATSFQLSLPVVSNIGAEEDLGGVLCYANGNVAGTIVGNVANNTALFSFTAPGTGNDNVSFHFGGRII